MILLDSSVVIDELRRPNARARRLFTETGAVICGVTRAEVLQGARTPAEVRDAIAATLAIQHGIEVWARDSHYKTFQEFIPELKLFEEPAA